MRLPPPAGWLICLALAGPAVAVDAPWQDADIGTVPVAGSSQTATATITVVGSGEGPWGTADACHYTYKALSGDGQITARVASLSGGGAWARAGVMVRAGTEAGAKQLAAFVSRQKGVADQARATTDGITSHTAGALGGAPTWVAVTREGSVLTAWESSDGQRWHRIAQESVSVGSTALIGLFVGAGAATGSATATFTDVQIVLGTVSIG